jgi:hypothetical protein
LQPGHDGDCDIQPEWAPRTDKGEFVSKGRRP